MSARGVAVLIAVVLAAGAAHGQEFDIFDANDFLDPREHGAVFRTDNPFGLSEAGEPFTVMRVFAGRIANDYQWRNVPTGAEANFVHLVTTFYRGDKQLTAKITSFQGDDDAELPQYRGTLQFGQYFVTADPIRKRAAPEDDDLRVVGRYLVTAAIEHNPYDDGRQFLHEYGLESTGYVRKGKRAVSGSFVWTHRIVSEAKSIDRVTYYYRVSDRTYLNGRFRWNAYLGVGGERNDGWHWGATRAVLTGAIEIPALRTGLNIAYAPTYVPGRGTRNTYHELAIFLDTTALRRLGRLID